MMTNSTYHWKERKQRILGGYHFVVTSLKVRLTHQQDAVAFLLFRRHAACLILFPLQKFRVGLNVVQNQTSPAIERSVDCGWRLATTSNGSTEIQMTSWNKQEDLP
jgi:hypothetical protein